MKMWGDLKVRTKLMVLVSIACLSLAAVGSMGLNDMRNGNLSLAKSNRNMELTAVLGAMKSDFLTMRLDLLYTMALKDPAKIKEKWEDFGSKNAAVRNGIKKLESMNLSETESRAVAEFRNGFEIYVTNGHKMAEMVMAAHAANDDPGLIAALKFGTEQVAPHYSKPAEVVSKLIAGNVKSAEDMFIKDTAVFKRSFLVMGAVIVASITLFLAMGPFIASSVANPLKKIFHSIEQMAAGNLAVTCDIDSSDEMGMLSGKLNVMAAKLHDIISHVARNGVEVASAASQMHVTAEQMATGAEQQTATTAEITNNIQQITAAVQLTANGSHESAAAAAQLARLSDDLQSMMGRFSLAAA